MTLQEANKIWEKPFNPSQVYEKDGEFYSLQMIQYDRYPNAHKMLIDNGWASIASLDTKGFIERQFKLNPLILGCLIHAKDAIYQTIHEAKLEHMPPASLIDSLQEIQLLLQEIGE